MSIYTFAVWLLNYLFSSYQTSAKKPHGVNLEFFNFCLYKLLFCSTR